MPTCLDLFSGAGGASKGYADAGFTVTGVDIKPQKRYPYEFIQTDAVEYLRHYGAEFDFIAASPPCQLWSEQTPMEYRQNHLDLITPVREILLKLGKPYAIENVENARHMLRNPLMLCGTMFGLRVWRHRYFELAGFSLAAPAPCKHVGIPVTPYPGSNARVGRPPGHDSIVNVRAAMEIPWMTGQEIREAIPPKYTEYIGRAALAALAR